MRRNEYLIYIIDTSSLIEMKDKYPEDTFPTVRQKMDELYTEGRLIAPLEVEKEIRDDELKKWIKDKRKMFIKPDKVQSEKIKEILKNFPFLAKSENPDSPVADPWIISLAIVKNNTKQARLFPEKYIIVTEESKTKLNRIPAVARHYHIECINLIELFRKEGWKF